MDVTATPKHKNGGIFAQAVADYQLMAAISQNVAEHRVRLDVASRAKLPGQHSAKLAEQYADCLDLGVLEWRRAYEEHDKLGEAILLVMTDERLAPAMRRPRIWSIATRT